MEIIGKVYRDFIFTDIILDGKSRQKDVYNFGGIGNIIKDTRKRVENGNLFIEP